MSHRYRLRTAASTILALALAACGSQAPSGTSQQNDTQSLDPGGPGDTQNPCSANNSDGSFCGLNAPEAGIANLYNCSGGVLQYYTICGAGCTRDPAHGIVTDPILGYCWSGCGYSSLERRDTCK
jgi:hypothetical protein